MGKQDIARAGRAGYQRAVDDMMAYDAIKHLDHVAGGRRRLRTVRRCSAYCGQHDGDADHVLGLAPDPARR